MKAMNTFILLSIICFVAVLSSCSKPGNSPAEHANQADEAIKVVPVEIFHVRTGNIAEIVTATGTIQPFREAYVASEASGRITRVNFEVGDNVRAGDLLVQLDDELSRLAVDQAEAQRLQAKATYEKAAKDLERHERLSQDGSITEFELETTKVNEQVSESNYLLAEAV